jgi:hypothetical protein
MQTLEYYNFRRGEDVMDFLWTLLGTLFWIGFTFFCMYKGNDWGVGAFILWLIGMLILGSYYGTIRII